jgi:hypothetical protein
LLVEFSIAVVGEVVSIGHDRRRERAGGKKALLRVMREKEEIRDLRPTKSPPRSVSVLREMKCAIPSV